MWVYKGLNIEASCRIGVGSPKNIILSFFFIFPVRLSVVMVYRGMSTETIIFCSVRSTIMLEVPEVCLVNAPSQKCPVG